MLDASMALPQIREVIRVIDLMEQESMKRGKANRLHQEGQVKYTGFICEVDEKRVVVEAEYHPAREERDDDTGEIKQVPVEVHLLQAYTAGSPVLRDLRCEERKMIFDWAVEHFAAEGLDVEGLR